ncbi:MAG: hypothetical protein FWD34_00005, partial [Oscillospiraceae bacterium]|nr:hypothetical protein [Oscillospiraceae bacterium]
APITAFQRNSDSGSQMRMVKFMDNTPLMEKDVRYYEGMGDIIVAIADFDDGKYSIAYNMYTFTEKQYTHNDVMLLSVDGVKPTDKTIFADEYPLVIYNYIYYDKNNPEASEFAENLYIYLMSEEGQRLIGQSGYVTLNVLFDRNLNISKPPSVDNYDDWISFYNKETGEFYEPDGQGGLLVFDNYADFILHDTVYMNHAGGREFLTAIYNSDYRIGPFDAELNNNYIHFTHFWDPAGTATDALLYMYDDMYFYSLSYNFLTGNVELMTAGKEFFDWVFPYLSEKLPEHVDNYEPNVAVIISISDLKNLYLIDYSKSILYGDTPALEYYQPFK